MAILSFDRIGITGVAACVPKQKIVNAESTDFFTPKEIKAAIQKTGIAERRVVDDYRLLQYDLLLGRRYAMGAGGRAQLDCGLATQSPEGAIP